MEVPWNGATVWLGMTGWLLCSVTVGFIFIPFFMTVNGISSFSQFTGTQRVTLLFLTQLLETAAGLGVVFLATRSWRREEASELFHFSLRKPFEKRYGWLIWAIIGISLSIGVNAILSVILYELGMEGSGAGTVDSVVGMLSLDPVTYLSLLSVVGFLAPVLEETVFRGFLLTSLTKWMPTYQAIAISSVIFGCAHLTFKDLPYLTVVGSRNLATPMLMHSLWNSTVLTILYVLTALGIDVKQLI